MLGNDLACSHVQDQGSLFLQWIWADLLLPEVILALFLPGATTLSRCCPG